MTKILLTLLTLLLAGCISPPLSPSPAAVSVPGPTGIGGVVVDAAGRAAAGAHVYAYRNPRGGLRGPADFEAPVDDDGRYFLDLVAGSYHLVARMRHGGGDAGPPRRGDAWGVWPRNPLQVGEGMTTRADFVIQEVSQPRLLREGSLSSGETGFTGTLIDAAGAPVAGAFVLAYRTPDQRRMPDHTSAAVGADGRFTLYLPKAGRYCLAARSKTRGQPVAGEPYGLLAPGDAGCREAVAGAILDVGTIVLTPYSPHP